MNRLCDVTKYSTSAVESDVSPYCYVVKRYLARVLEHYGHPYQPVGLYGFERLYVYAQRGHHLGSAAAARGAARTARVNVLYNWRYIGDVDGEAVAGGIVFRVVDRYGGVCNAVPVGGRCERGLVVARAAAERNGNAVGQVAAL